MITTLSPALQQYHHFKAKHPDYLLLFHIGDFYEALLDDAAIVASVCGVMATTRSVPGGDPIAVAGVPFHSVEQHLRRLIAAGHKCAICEPTEPS